MKSSSRAIGHAVLAALLLLAGAAPQIHAYKGRLGHFDSAGGVQAGPGRSGAVSLGAQTIGTSVSAAYETREGLLAVFGQPVLQADETALDFGAVGPSGSRTLTATVRNYGGVSLLLANPRLASSSDSGPFAIEEPVGTTHVDPGGSLEVRVRFGPEEAALARDTLLVTTNVPALPVWRLPLSGSGDGGASPAIVLAPDALDFGRAPLDSVVTRTLTVENVGGADLHVGPIAASDPAFVADAESFVVGPGGRRDVGVSFHPAEARIYADTLRVPCDDPAHTTPILVLLSGRVPSVLAVLEPGDLDLLFEAARDGPSPGAQEVRIGNGGAEVLHWKAVSSGPAWLEAVPDSGSVLPGNATSIDVGVAPAGLPIGDHEAGLILENADRPAADADTVRVTLRILPFSLQVSSDEDTVREGEGVAVVASASVPVDSGRVFYRMGGEGAYTGRSMDSQGLATLSTALPGASFTMRGVEWFVRAYAAGEEVVEPDPGAHAPRRVFVRIEDAASPSIPANEHRMIAIPLSTGGAGADALLADDLGAHDPAAWRLGRWSQEESICREHPDDLGAALDAGNGFWLIVRSAASFKASGLSVFPPDGDTLFSIPLAGGAGSVWWTQIGQPFAYPVAWASCFIRDGALRTYPVEDAAVAGLVENVAYSRVVEGGEGRYDAASILEPWRGYFVNNISGGALELLVPQREASPLKIAEPIRPPSAREGEWELRLRAVADRVSGSVVIGERAGARGGWDAFDHFTPPSPDGGVPVLAIRNPGGMPVSDDLSADIRAPSTSVASWDILVRFERPGEVLLFTESGSALPAGSGAFLVDDVAGISIAWGDGSEHRIVPRPGETARAIRVVSGFEPSLRAEGYESTGPLPRFELDRPHPNPARGGTTIRYAIPEAGPVRLRLFNIEGRLVRDLGDEAMDAGEHIAAWDGRDGSGREVPPGLYFFRLDHGNQARTTRVVVFR